MKKIGFFIIVILSVNQLFSREIGFWERVKKISEHKEILVDCRRFCQPANEYESYNNCNGVYLRNWRRSNINRPKKNKPLYYFPKRGGICARKKNLNFRNQIKFREVEKMCECNSSLPAASGPRRRKQVDAPVTQKTLQKLKLRREQVNQWILCHDLNYGRIATPESVKPCAQINGVKIPLTNGQLGQVKGDKIYHMGQLCLSGSYEFCAGVKSCQDTEEGSSTYGAFYRSPGTKKDPTYTGNKGTHFSRDMLLGAMAYLVKTKDKEAAINWINFVAGNKKVSRVDVPIIKWMKRANICPLIGGESKADDRCAMVIDSWGLLYRVYNYLGLMDSPRIPKKMKRKMKLGRVASGTGMFFNSLFSPAEGMKVFMGGLQINNILIRRETGQELPSMKLGARHLAKESRYINPFFMFADMGPTEHGAQMLLKFCPAERPKYGEKAFPDGPWIDGVNLWVRLSFFQTRQPYGSYQVSGGYDCLMALNYYLSHHKKPYDIK